MKKNTHYPVVLLHGMFGWGQQHALERVFPYFGFYNVNIRKMFLREGVKAVAPSMGPFTGAWDRACEVYAQLVGGTVDYGKAHSEKYGHARFGRTYEKPLLPEWGSVDADDDLVKVNLIGHSFGGVTGRTLIELLVNGSEEERAVTSPEDLSPLFAGGHADWVHSMTALAAPHDGSTIFNGWSGIVFDPFARYFCRVINALDCTPFKKVYDLGLDMFDITPTQYMNPLKGWKGKELDAFFAQNDNLIYDATLEGATALNKTLGTQPNIYYLSFHGCRTVRVPVLGWEVPRLKSVPLFNIFGVLIGLQTKGAPDKSYRPNDMLVNEVSGQAPTGDPRTDEAEFPTPGADYAPGVWHVFPVEVKDHLSYCGWAEPRSTYAEFYRTIYSTVSSLPPLNR